MQFTYPWHDRVRPLWETLIGQLLDGKVESYLEIGSFEGASACHAIEIVGRHPNGRVVCVDPWDENYPNTLGEHTTRPYQMDVINQQFRDNIREARALAVNSMTITVYSEESYSAFAKMLLDKESFDMIYIDGSHHAQDVLLDGMMAWKLLRPGGILIFDDYFWNPGGKYNPVESPKCAIDTFITLKYDETRVTAIMSRQLLVQKKKED